MPFWQRVGITVVAMLITSFLAGLIWRIVIPFGIPSYLAGLIGGLTAIPLWELLKKYQPKKSS